MPCTPEAVEVLRKANVLIAPAMAAGAGGVCYCLLYRIASLYTLLARMLKWNQWLCT